MNDSEHVAFLRMQFVNSCESSTSIMCMLCASEADSNTAKLFTICYSTVQHKYYILRFFEELSIAKPSCAVAMLRLDPRNWTSPSLRVAESDMTAYLPA